MAELRIEVVEAGADEQALEQLTADLRRELLELDVDAVEPVPAGPSPEGSKGLDLVALGALLVQLRSSLPLVTSVVSTVRRWLLRSGEPGRSLKVTIDGRTLELSAATSEQQERLVEQFLASVDTAG